MRPRTVSSLISYIEKCDPRYMDIEVHKSDDRKTLRVAFQSASANITLKEEVDLPLLSKMRGSGWYILEWDISNLGAKKKVEPYCFSREHRRVRRMVTRQEDAAAEMIGGRRHIGSGAIPGIKSDASSADWQVEAKMATHRKSISISIDWLQKITHEAVMVGKHPMMYLTYQSIPSDVRIEDTWVVIPRSVFELKFSEC